MSKCKVCKIDYKKSNSTQVVCSVLCAAKLQIIKRIAKDKKETKIKLDALKTKPQLTKELQKVFNAYIRQRDYGNNCISCDKTIDWESSTSTGGVCDAGHYLSVGSRVHLRFNEDNVHAQCKYCNNYLAGNPASYRVGLIKKIGLDRVKALECNSTVNKHSTEHLKGMIDYYKLNIKNIKNDKQS